MSRAKPSSDAEAGGFRHEPQKNAPDLSLRGAAMTTRGPLKMNIVGQKACPEQDNTQSTHQREEGDGALVGDFLEIVQRRLERIKEDQRQPCDGRGRGHTELRRLNGSLPKELHTQPEQQEEPNDAIPDRARLHRIEWRYRAGQ